MAAADYLKVYRQALQEGWDLERVDRELAAVAALSPAMAPYEQFQAIYQLPVEARWRFLKQQADKFEPK